MQLMRRWREVYLPLPSNMAMIGPTIGQALVHKFIKYLSRHAETWLIQKRLVKIVQTSIPQHSKQEVEPMAQINLLDTRLEELGHHLEINKSGKYYSCLLCGQQWNKQHRKTVISNGVCPGPRIWGEKSWYVI